MLAVLVQAAAVAARPPPSLGPGAGAWVLEDPEPFGVSTEELDLVAKRAALAMPVRYCMLMAVDGHLIHETYFHNSSEATYEADSLAKTMTAQVVGVAVSKGLIDLDKPIVEYGVKPRCAGGAGYSPPPVNATCAALLRTLCPHVAPPYDCNGWSDVYPPLNKSFACSAGCLQNKNVTNALRKAGCSYRDGQDWCRKIPGDDGCWRDCRTGKSYFETLTTRHLLAQTSGVGVAPPGTHWTYDSDQYIDHLAYIVSKVTNESSASWATREYLIPMGLPPDLFAYDGFVDPVDGPEFSPGGGQMMSCRDHLRVAQLLINKGKWPVGGDGAGNGNTRNSVNNAANASRRSSSDDDGDVNAGHTLETTMYYLNKTVVTNKTVLGTCLPCCKEPQPGTQVCCCPPPGCAIPPSCPPPPTPPPAPPSPPPPSPGPGPPSPRQYTQLLSEAYVKEFLTPSFPNQVSTAYGFLMWLNQPANDLHCCAARWGSFGVVEPPACFASKSKFGSTCRVQTCAGHHIDNHLVNDGLTMMQAPNDLALGMGQSSKYIMTIPSEGLAVVTLGLSWPSSSKCPQGLVNVGGEALMNGTILPAGARAIASGYDDSFGSTQIWRSFGNKMRQLAAARQAAGVTSDTPIPLIEEVKDDAEAEQNAARRANEARSIAAPAAAATTTAVPAPGPLPFRSKHRSAQLQYYKQLQQPSINIHSRTSAGSAFSSSSSGGSSGGVTGGRGGGGASGGGGGSDGNDGGGNTASTGGACYCTCPPMMGFGICANMPAGTADGDCSSILGTAADVCPSHGAPRQCHSPEIPEDTDCSNVLSNDRSSMACTLLTGCRNLPGAGENGFPPPEANFTFSSCLCKPQAFEAKSCHWTSDPCIYSPFFPT